MAASSWNIEGHEFRFYLNLVYLEISYIALETVNPRTESVKRVRFGF